MRVDLEDDDWLGDRSVEERTDALNLIAKRAMDEADLLETRTTRRYPVLTSPLGGFPIPGQGDVENVLGVALHQGSTRARPISPRGSGTVRLLVAGTSTIGEPVVSGRNRSTVTCAVLARPIISRLVAQYAESVAEGPKPT